MILYVGVYLILKVVRRLVLGRSYVLQFKFVHMGKLVWVVLFCGGQGREIVYFYRKWHEQKLVRPLK